MYAMVAACLQTRVAVCEPVATSTAGGGVHEGRMANRRRMGDSDASQAGAAGGAGAGGGGFGGGGEEGVGAGGGGGAAGFPVHVSCMAISGGAMATAAGEVSLGPRLFLGRNRVFVFVFGRSSR